MYNFTSLDWHHCEYKKGSKDKVNHVLYNDYFRIDAIRNILNKSLNSKLRLKLED